ncbi:MAG: hypothetical protein R6W76_21580, partial [Caldilinea sp.]
MKQNVGEHPTRARLFPGYQALARPDNHRPCLPDIRISGIRISGIRISGIRISGVVISGIGISGVG